MAYQNLNYSGASINNLLDKCDNASSGGSTSDYITSSTMSSTYLTKTSASSSYQPIGSYMTTSTYNSLLDKTEATDYNSNLNTYLNTYCSQSSLLNKYYPVGSVMLTRCFYNDSTYGTKLIDPADLIGGSWTLMSGVIYQTGSSGGGGSISGSNTVFLDYQSIAVANSSSSLGSQTISHTHTCPSSKKFYACQATFGEANRNSPAGSGYYYPRISSATDIGGSFIEPNSDTHGSTTLTNTDTMSIDTKQAGINIGIWRRTS